MEYKVESSLYDFPAWAGAVSTLELLKERGDCDEAEAFLVDLFCDRDDVTDTEINDILWFDNDAIAEHLGYRDWDAYIEGWSESDLQDADDWFCELDFDELEELTGKRRDDYSDEDGYQDFVDACEIWWNAKSDNEKVELYYQNE